MFKEPASPIRISASAIRAYERCSLAYAFDNVERVPDAKREPVPAFAFGNAVHKAIAQFTRTGGHAKRSVDDLIELAMRNWPTAGFADEAASYEAFERAREQLEAFFFNPYPDPTARTIAIEAYASWRGYRRGILAVGRFDRVVLHEDGVLEIIDFKTGTRVPEREDLERDWQTILYSTLARDRYAGLAPATIRISYVYLAGPTVHTIVLARELFDERWADVESIVSQIRRDRRYYERGLAIDEAFVPNRGDHCAGCQFRHHCAKLAEHRATPVEGPEEAI